MQPAAASKKTITAAPNTIRRSTAPVFGVASVRFPFFDVFPLLFFLFDEVLCVFPLLLGIVRIVRIVCIICIICILCVILTVRLTLGSALGL